jgi:cytochrome b involved in lipid metabolism
MKKRHFEEKKAENVQHVKNIQYVYLLTKYIKYNFGG